MTGPDITVLWKKQYLNDQNFFWSKNALAIIIVALLKLNKKSVLVPFLPLCDANEYSPKLNKQISKKEITLSASH